MTEIVRRERENGTFSCSRVLDPTVVTEQANKDIVDIKRMMKKYRKTGMLKQRVDECSYGDYTNAVDFHEAHNRLIAAQNDFKKVPAKIRKRFDNDIGKLLDFIQDEANAQECVDLGLRPISVLKVPEVPEGGESPPDPEPERPA